MNWNRKLEIGRIRKRAAEFLTKGACRAITKRLPLRLKTIFSGESVVFRRGHTAAIRLDVKVSEEHNEQWLGLLVKFKNELLSRSNEQPEWNLCRVRILLQA